MENLLKRCHCSSEFNELTSSNDLTLLLQTFKHLAGKFSMLALEETICQILHLINNAT